MTDVATGTTRTVVRDNQVVDAAHWSADGSSLVFYALDDHVPGDPEEHFSIYVVGADGTGLTRLTEGRLPVWMDDGRIAFVRMPDAIVNVDRETGAFESRIYGPARFFTMNADGTDIQQRYEAPGDVPIEEPEWSPDGSRVAAAAVLHGNMDIFAVDLALRTPIRLTDDPAQDTGPAWSPDGAQIAFNTGRWSPTPNGPLSQIALMNADGSDVRRLTHSCWNDYFATWVKDDSVVKTLPVWSPEDRTAWRV